MRRENLPRVASLVLTAFALSGTLILIDRLIKDERAELERRTNIESQFIATQVQLGVLNHVEPLERLGAWWVSQGRPMGPEDWGTDALLFLKRSSGLRRVFWFNPFALPGWSAVPGSPPDAKFRAESEVKNLVRKVRRSGSPALLTAFDTPGGEPALYVCVPIESDHRIKGYLVGLYSMAELTEASFPSRMPQDFQVRVTSHGRNIYSRMWQPQPNAYVRHMDIKVFDDTWTVSARLIANHFVGFKSLVSSLGILIVGSLYASALLVYFASRRAGELQRANAALAFQMEVRRRAEAQEKAGREERRELERKLLHAQKMQSLGVMAAGFAHDFNNLLTVILGNAEVALEDIPQTSEARPPVQSIVDESRSAADLVHKVLEYTGTAYHILKPIAVEELMAGAKDSLREIAGGRAELQFRFETRLPTIKVDAEEIRQVVANVVRNAVEAVVPPSGLIEIAASVCQLNADDVGKLLPDEELAPGTYVRIDIKDNGSGMPPEIASRAFDPFFSTKFLGRGLGLSVAQGIMRAHHGAVRVESAISAGACFQLFFPATTCPPVG